MREVRADTLVTLRVRVLPLVAAGLVVLLAIGLALAPAEARLGNVLKLVYVHAALVWTGLILFSVAGGLGLLALISRRATWYRGSAAAARAALAVWIACVASSMLVTGLTWGQWIAWNEPRVRVTALILAAAVVLTLVGRLVDHRDFDAAGNLLMGVAPWTAVERAGVIRHPVDPIGGSASTAIQSFHVLIALTVGALAAVLVAWLWAGRELRG